MPVITIRWQAGAKTCLNKILLLEFSDHFSIASADVNGHNQILLVAAGVVHYRGDVLEIDSVNDEARMTNVKRMTNYRMTNGENDLVANFVIPMQGRPCARNLEKWQRSRHSSFGIRHFAKPIIRH
jgi:hypothetical protein